jgi:hypothetical protein
MATVPGLGDVGIGAAPTGGMTSTQQNAWALLQQTLQQYGFSGADLTQLVAWAKGEVIRGSSANQIALDLQNTPQFERRFPAIKTLAGEGVAVTPAEYITLERTYAQLEQNAGLPANFASYDALIGGQVSPSEYSDRINKGYLAVEAAPQETVNAMQQYYGVSKGQLAAYFLNPKAQEPVLLQQAMAAQIGGAGAVSGLGRPVSADEAFRLAQMGVTYQQAQQGFQKLAHEAQLYQGTLPGQGAPAIDTQKLLEQQFGSDAQTQLELQIRADYEKGTTNVGTNVATTQAGATGLGTVQR